MLVKDFHFALRILRKYPGTSLVTILIMAGGIGLNTGMFAIVNAVLLRPLPFPDSNQLVQVQKEWQPPWLRAPEITCQLDVPEVLAWLGLENHDCFSQIGAYDGGKSFITTALDGWEVRRGRVTASLFAMLGGVPVMGRSFTAEEEKPGAPGVIILDHAFWIQHFGGDRGAVGGVLMVDEQPCQIIGVLAPSFRLPERFDIYTPLRLRKRDPQYGGFPRVIGRLNDGVPLKRAEASLNIVYQAVADPKERGKILLQKLQDQLAAPVRTSLFVYQAAIICVLLIGCANVTHLQLARCTAREREVAVRLALGAQRRQLFYQFLTESLAFAMVGGGLGVCCAFWFKGVLALVIPALPGIAPVQIDARVVIFTVGLSLVATVLCGVVPAFRASQLDLADALKAGATKQGTRLLGTVNTTALLVIGEICIALVLLTGAGLLLKTFLKIQAVDLGFRANQILTFTVTPSKLVYSTANQRMAYYTEVLRMLKQVPGVKAIGAGDVLPLVEGGWTAPIYCRSQKGYVGVGTINQEYPSALGIRLKQGQTFSDADRSGRPLVALVNESFVKTYLTGQTPLGQTFLFYTNQLTVVGVVGDIRRWGYKDDGGPHVYLHYLQAADVPLSGNYSMSFALQTERAPSQYAADIRKRVHNLGRDVAIKGFISLEQLWSDTVVPQRLNMWLSGGLGVIALVLAAFGIYGVVAFATAQRTREFGIRAALGAEPVDLTRMVLKEGAMLACVGIVFGCAAAYALSRYIDSLLYQMEPLDIPIFASAAALVLLVTLVACYFPGRRAAQVDPMTVLRLDQ
jgi:putative ABC transport system permease protein